MSEAGVSSSSNYRQILAEELKRRVSANPRYSMRSFAGNLGVSPAFLSKVLRSQKNVSLKKAIEICEELGFTNSETQQFCSTLRTPVSDLKKIFDKSETHDISALQLDEFEAISDWWHYAIRELTECRDFNPQPTAIAKRLGITTEAAELAVQRMLKLGLLQKIRGRLKKAQNYIATPSGQPSKALRTFHMQMIEKAALALEVQSVKERDISGVTMAIHPEKLDEAKAEIKKFRRRMAKLLDASRPTSVYQLNVQLFRLSEETHSDEN